MNRTRNYCFTLNNYTEEDELTLTQYEGNKQIKYLIVGKEIGEQGTPHLQGFIIFQNAKTFNQVKAFLGDRYHIERTIGSAQQNIAYCSKDNEYIEFGELPQQGSRKDIQQVKQMVKEGKSMSEIVEQATSYQSIRMAEICKKYQPIQPRDKPEVRYYWGGTGCGKTRLAYEELGMENTWVNSNTLQWFDGYDGQENVIIDDFRGNQCSFAFLLRLLDRYPMKVPIKGGFVNWNPKRIFITSTNSPYNVYSDEKITENIEQLIRRIDIIQNLLKE